MQRNGMESILPHILMLQHNRGQTSVYKQVCYNVQGDLIFQINFIRFAEFKIYLFQNSDATILALSVSPRLQHIHT